MTISFSVQHTIILEIKEVASFCKRLFFQPIKDFWNGVGWPINIDQRCLHIFFIELTFRECKLVSSKPVTHDTKLFTFELPAKVYYETPIGNHVIVKCIVEGKMHC